MYCFKILCEIRKSGNHDGAEKLLKVMINSNNLNKVITCCYQCVFGISLFFRL